ncbi:uncharacterized protein J3R85_016317 [Psidium guajava]|nr:uncharacterized protein J3R85_016317 [Psidium guajava]
MLGVCFIFWWRRRHVGGGKATSMWLWIREPFLSPSHCSGCFAQRKRHSMCTIFPHISFFATKESVFFPYLSSVQVCVGARERERRRATERDREGDNKEY